MDKLEVTWSDTTYEKFQKLIAKVPKSLQDIAQDKVLQKVQFIVQSDNRSVVSEKDLVSALFEVTPFGFHGPLKCDMDELHIDYTQYGYSK